jgi:hypothetical protein
MSSFRHKSTTPSSLRKIGIDKHHRKNDGGLSRSLHCRGGDCSHEDEIDVLASTLLAAKSKKKKRHTAPRRTTSNKLDLQTPNMSSFRHKSTSLSSSSSIRKIDIDKHHRKIHGGLSRSPRCQGTLPSSNSEETLNESDDDEILFTTTRRSGGRKSRRKKSNSSNRPSTAQRLGQREMMKSGEKEKSQSRSPPSNKNTQRRGGRRSSTLIERELRSFEKITAGVGQRNNSVTTTSPVLKNGYESSGELSRSTCQSTNTNTNTDDDKKRDIAIFISPIIGIVDKSKDIDKQKRNSGNGVKIAPRRAFLRRSQSLSSVNALKSIRRVPLTNNPTSKTLLIDSKKKSNTSRLFKGFNSVTTTDGKHVPAVQNSTDESTSATTMVLPDSAKSEMRFAPQKQQQQQQRPSPVLKNGYESSGELSRSTCQSTNTNTDDDKERDISIIISPIIGIVVKSKDINEQKRNSDCKRFQQQFQKHNGVRIAPRSAFLLRSQSVNALKSIRNSHSSKTPVIDSKKNSIASRLFKGIKHKGKGKDKYKDIDMDRIEEAIIHRDDNIVDECTYDNKYNNKTVTDSRSKIVKKYDDNIERESTCVKLPTNKHQATKKYRSRNSLKKENRETMECGLMMSVTSFSDDVTSDLIDHFGGKDNDTTLPLKEGNPLTLLDSDPKANKKYGDNLTGNDVENSITAMLEESDEMISMASFSTNDTIDLSAHSGGGNKSSRADTIMNRMDDVNGTTILEEDSFSNDDSCNGDSGDADRANDMTKNEDEKKIVQDIVTKEKIVESKCIQINFSHLSKSGTGDLFLGSIAR